MSCFTLDLDGFVCVANIVFAFIKQADNLDNSCKDPVSLQI